MTDNNTPSQVPLGSNFAGANAGSKPGHVFGDAMPRKPPSQGSNLSMGMSEQYSFADTTPEELGMGRNDANGKPMGPETGAVDNGGAGASLIWG
jgi:hypothetical protein